MFPAFNEQEVKYAKLQLQLLAMPSSDLVHGPLGEELHHGRWRCSDMKCEREMTEHRRMKSDGMCIFSSGIAV